MYQKVPTWDNPNRKEPQSAGNSTGALPVPEPDKDFYAQHARRSRAARAWANMNADELTDALGKKDRKYVQRRENGQALYTPGDLLKIAEVTGAPVDFMVHGKGWTPYKPTVAELAAKTARKLAVARARKQRSKLPTPTRAAENSEQPRTPEA